MRNERPAPMQHGLVINAALRQGLPKAEAPVVGTPSPLTSSSPENNNVRHSRSGMGLPLPRSIATHISTDGLSTTEYDRARKCTS